MTFIITTESPAVVPASASHGTGEGQQVTVSIAPTVTVSGENTLLNG